MKRKILSLILCLGLAVGMLVGCSTKEVDTASDKVEMDSSIKEKENINARLAVQPFTEVKRF